jgi:geranylgeranyl diphosphate synthase type 3
MLRGVGADLISGISLGWSAEKENILKGPFDYLESHPGKDIRSSLIAAFNNWLQVPSSSLRTITGVVTMLHTASLLIDDVEDSSQLRRGVPVAHSIFGTAQTINSANYVYFLALQELAKLNNPAAIRIYTEELLNLHRGQGMDLFWRDTLTCPSEDDYLEMVGNKTGGLFRLAIKLMCAESPSHNFTTSGLPTATQTDYIPLVNTVGLLFQILDDYKNLSDTTYTSNKGLCEDLTEGKFSFPIIHSIRSDPNNLVLINILKQKTQDEEVKRYAVAYMEKTGSFTYTRRVLRGLTKKALQLVDEVDGGRGRSEGIKDVLERLRVERQESRKSGGSG